MTAEHVDRQELRKRRTRQAIQTAALELFAERGYRETTINDIAERWIDKFERGRLRALSDLKRTLEKEGR